VSEYQYYEFAAVDRPLNERQLAAVRALSTRAHITSTSFVNTYEWGNFSGDPRRMVERYYDAFLYLANWGTRELILRFPARLLDLDGVQRYCGGDAVSAWGSGGYVVVAAVAEDDEADFEWGGEGVLASILPVRSEILAGDESALYLLWLLGVQTGETQGDVVEPPVPAGLDRLTGSQTALAEFLRIDEDLLAVAAAGSTPRRRTPVDVGGWVAGLAAAERDALLVRLLSGDDLHLRAETLRRLEPAVVESGARRTARQLADAAVSRRDERERAARVRREQAAAERERRRMETRRERLAALAAEGEAAWARVATRIAEKKPAGYDAAVELLVDLQEVTGKAEFARRVEVLRAEHRRKPGLIGRLATAGL
jgi:hypothetical protein